MRVLPEAVANQIAAGEVVERPASVLKELLENSLDAGASRIMVEVAAGGRRLIRVVDDGRGMDPDDLLLSLERHATSKVQDSEDLLKVATFGFRGEALPSIASVSRMTLRSRPQGAESGSEVQVVGGSVREVQEIGCPSGTQVEVKDLFFNTPARRKFLKSQTTESAHLTSALMRLALGNPQTAFRFSSGGKVVYDLPPSPELAVRAAALLGREVVDQMVSVQEQVSGLQIKGLAGMPSLHRAAYDQVYTLVNNRYVRDRVLIHAVAEAYKGLLPMGRRPVLVVNLIMDPAQVDVNVHPAKTEVRFRRQQQVHDGLVEGLRQGLAAARKATKPPIHVVPRAHTPKFSGGSNTVLRPEPEQWKRPRPIEREIQPPSLSTPPPPEEPGEAAPPARPEIRPLFSPVGDLQVLGQLHGLYILCSSPEGLVIVDQHAAHERLTYESLKRSMQTGGLPGQGLLVPATLELTPQEAAWAESQAGDWRRLGLEMEPFGGLTWAVVAIPPLLSGRDVSTVVRDLLSELHSAGVSAQTPEFLEVALRSLACRSSIMSGQNLGGDELSHLVNKAASLPPPVTCPHGRPVFLSLSRGQLARYFKRSSEPGP
ncbi:MAG: DNA mismatch repair endonuclease MutL [Desulfarculaceae bacterium]